MKKLISPVMFLALIQFPDSNQSLPTPKSTITPSHNLFIITLDGFRWQEVFTGADSAILHNEVYTPDRETIKLLYWANTADERRKKLMPFFWQVLADRGLVFGNRNYGSKVNAANLFALSYPGYNEIFTGNTDARISTNKKRWNKNINVLEYLNNKPALNGKIAAFTSWDVFPYIFNTKRNDLPVNSGYAEWKDSISTTQRVIKEIQTSVIEDKTATRHDQLTFLSAMEYLQQNRPRLLYLGLGETDEHAHNGRYDLYLEKANEADKMIARLWHWVQTTPGYRDNTTFIITTDHGRGRKTANWTSHGEFIQGSSQVWIAMMGPGLVAAGEIKNNDQLYLQQLAQTIALLLGENFDMAHPAPALALK